jgi:DNA end-binding protein Ku
VRLYSAVQSTRPHFVLLHEVDGSPVERIYKSRESDKEIPASELVRGIEFEPGHFVTLTANELARSGTDDKTIDVKQFSDLSDISPLHYEKPYYLVPSNDGQRAYALLREALQRTQKVAITQFKAYGKEHIGAISAAGDLLILYQLRFADEIISRSRIESPAIPKANPNEIEVLIQVIERFSGPFFVHDFRDEQTDQLNLLIDRKIKGLPAPRAESSSPQATSDEDLMPVLRSTLESSGPTISASTALDSQPKKGVKNAANRSATKR